MKNNSFTGMTWGRRFLPVALLFLILAVLFGKSFLPDYVHFSNDGPLGQQNTTWSQLPQAFTGSWGDLNNIGGSPGAFPLGLNALIRWALGPVGYAKFLVPIALLILGLGAWTFFRQLRLSPLASTLGALAAALNSTFFASACWGVAPQQIAAGMVFFALALIVSNTAETPPLVRWVRLALAGMAVGVNVIEAADIGAIFSLFVALFVLVKTLADKVGSIWSKGARAVGSVVVIAVCAGCIATQTVVALVGAQITGIMGTGQDAESKAARFDWATQWSLPKVETLGLCMPGVFGYKMNTPDYMPDYLRDAYQGGIYWGGMGRDPVLDRFFDKGGEGDLPPHSFMRQTGGQNYAGITVILIAAWAIAQSLRRKDSVFVESQRKFIWFWALILFGSVFLAWGRFTPFDLYKHTIYALPYFSTIRNPAKFVLVFSLAAVTLFAYGVHGLSQRYLAATAAGASSRSSPFKNWRVRLSSFDRQWIIASLVLFGASLIGWLIYASEKPSLVRYLQKVGFGNEELANLIATFSIGQVGWFVVLVAAVAGLCALIIAGAFSGQRAKVGGVLLGALLVFDLVRANLPYVIHWDYKEKYASNPIIDFLKDKPYEHRVMELRPPEGVRLPGYDMYFHDLYAIEWVQQLFPYYNIQSLDIVQRPRPPVNEAAYEMAFMPRTPDETWLVARRWQLTNTRYFLGVGGLLNALNEQLDPRQRRFRIVQRFSVVPKPGITGLRWLEQMTVVPADTGGCALFEFTGALPRVKLYSNWQVITNDEAVLKTLAAAGFEPANTVLVSAPAPNLPVLATNENSGTVEFKQYHPKHIVFAANAVQPSVLLLNDKHDPHWQVWVDGQPAELLRCNFIMRGVYLTPGAHTVEFKFLLPNGPLYVSLAAFAVGIFLSGCLIVWQRRTAAGRNNGNGSG
jgi:hypothetical protein